MTGINLTIEIICLLKEGRRDEAISRMCERSGVQRQEAMQIIGQWEKENPSSAVVAPLHQKGPWLVDTDDRKVAIPRDDGTLTVLLGHYDLPHLRAFVVWLESQESAR